MLPLCPNILFKKAGSTPLSIYCLQDGPEVLQLEGDSPDLLELPLIMLQRVLTANWDDCTRAEEVLGARTAIPVRAASHPKIKLRGKRRRGQRKCLDKR